jgi:hypothetical protein
VGLKKKRYVIDGAAGQHHWQDAPEPESLIAEESFAQEHRFERRAPSFCGVRGTRYGFLVPRRSDDYNEVSAHDLVRDPPRPVSSNSLIPLIQTNVNTAPNQ